MIGLAMNVLKPGKPPTPPQGPLAPPR